MESELLPRMTIRANVHHWERGDCITIELADESSRLTTIFTDDKVYSKMFMVGNRETVIVGSTEETILSAHRRISEFPGLVIQKKECAFLTLGKVIVGRKMEIDAPMFTGAYNAFENIGNLVPWTEEEEKYLTCNKYIRVWNGRMAPLRPQPESPVPDEIVIPVGLEVPPIGPSYMATPFTVKGAAQIFHDLCHFLGFSQEDDESGDDVV